MILLNVFLDRSLIETLFLNKPYTAPDGSVRREYVVDKRIYPQTLFQAPIFTFVNCVPNAKTLYMLKISIGPRMQVSRFSHVEGGMQKLTIKVQLMLEEKKEPPPIRLYLAKTGLPLAQEQLAELRKHKWGYKCTLLNQPDKVIAYLYATPA